MTSRQSELQEILEAQQSILREDRMKLVGYGLAVFFGAAVSSFATVGLIDSWVAHEFNPSNTDVWIHAIMDVVGILSVVTASKQGFETGIQIAIGTQRIKETRDQIHKGT